MTIAFYWAAGHATVALKKEEEILEAKVHNAGFVHLHKA